LFELLVPEAGLRRVPSQTLRRLASTRAASVTVRTEPDRFVVAGRCDRASQAFQFEWLLAQATEPAFDAAAHRRVTESTGARYGFVGASVLGMRQAFAERLTGQAVGFLAERVAAVTLEQVQDLFAARWRGQPITLVAVGDLDVEATITIAARTFGTLPGRRAPDELAADLRYRPIERALQERLDLPAGETSSWIQFFVPLPDLQRSTIRRGHLLAALLRPRLASILREAMGATYDCQVEVQWFASAMPCGSISITAKVAPGREHDVEAAIRRELGSLVADGVTTEELNGARRQLRNVVQEARQNNAYWSVRLSWAHLRPAGLQEWTAAEDELQHLSAAQLSATAAQWCAAEHLSVLVLRAPAQAK
jgi:zinc protease